MHKVTLFVLVSEDSIPLVYKASSIEEAIKKFEKENTISIKQCYDYAISCNEGYININ